VEYDALINGLHIASELRVQWLYIYGNCQLIVNQVMGELNYNDRSISSRRSLMVSGIIISSSETMKQPTSLPDSGLATNRPI
jgi:ribonuclease HI